MDERLGLGVVQAEAVARLERRAVGLLVVREALDRVRGELRGAIDLTDLRESQVYDLVRLERQFIEKLFHVFE